MRIPTPPYIVVFLNSKDANLQITLREIFPMKKKHFIVSDNSLTIVNKVLAEAKKHYNKELEQKIEFIFHTDDSTSYKVIKRLASACKKSKKTRAYLTSSKFTFTNTTAIAVRTTAEEFCFALCNDPVDECPPCNMSFTLTPYKDVLATLSHKNAVYIKSDELLIFLSKETESWASANSIPTFIFDPQEEALPLISNYKKVFLQGSDPGLERIIGLLNTENFEGEVGIMGAVAVDFIWPTRQLELKQVKSGSKFNAASIQYSQLSNSNYDKNLAATVAAAAIAIPSLRWDFILSHPG